MGARLYTRFAVYLAALNALAQAHSPLPRSRFRAVTLLHAPCNTLSFTLANVAGVLGTDWPIALLYSDEVTEFVASTKLVRVLVEDGLLDVVSLERYGFDRLLTTGTGDSSMLLMSSAFWRFINAGHALMFSTDSVLCSLSPWQVDDFLGYDYVGAPTPGLDAGTGGLSLRNVSMMLHITETCPMSVNEHESAYFARCFDMMLRAGQRVNLPTPQVAASFAYETGVPPARTPFGVHKLDAVQLGPDGERHVTPRAEAVAATCPEIVAGVLLSCNVSEYREGGNRVTDMFLAAPNLRVGLG